MVQLFEGGGGGAGWAPDKTGAQISDLPPHVKCQPAHPYPRF